MRVSLRSLSALLFAVVVSACHESATPSTGPASTLARSVVTPDAAAATLVYLVDGTYPGLRVVSSPVDNIIATIDAGLTPSAVALSPDGKTAYLTDRGNASVLLVNTAINRVVGRVGVGTSPNGIALSPGGTRAYVANVIGTTSVIELASNTVVATVPTGLWSWHVAVSPDGAHVYVSRLQDTVSVINAATNTVVANVEVTGQPGEVLVTPDGKHVYVTRTYSDSIAVISTATNTLESPLYTGGHSYALADARDGRHVYVSGQSVYSIDMVTRAVVRQVTCVLNCTSLAVTPDGSRIYSADDVNSAFQVFDAATFTRVGYYRNATWSLAGVATATVPVPPRPRRPTRSGQQPGIAEKGLVEVCNAYVSGLQPATHARVVVHVQQGTSWRPLDEQYLRLTEGECQDVWYNPLDAFTRVSVFDEPPVGFVASCTSSQVGPRDAKYAARPCASPSSAVVFNSLDVGHAVKFQHR